MSPGQCPCPACGTTLRVRDRSFVGRQIECPDCRAKLVLKLNDDREFEAEFFKPEIDRPASRTSASREKSKPTTGNTRSFADTLHSPLVVAWALGIGLTAFVAIMLLRPAVRFRPPSTESAQPVAETVPDIEAPKPSEKSATDSVTQPPDPMPPSIVEKPQVPEVPPTPAEVTPPVPAADTEKPATVVTTPPETPKPVVPAPPKVNLEEVLKQRLSGFVTSSRKPTRRLDVIEQLDELTGHRIKFDRQELGEKKLMQTVSISVEVTTVGALLKLVLEPAGWEYVIEDDYLRLKPRQVAGTGTP